MKTYIFSILLILNLGMFAQNISKTDFQESVWFTNVDGENLFETDILILSKIIAFEPKKHPQMLPFLEMDYLKETTISLLDFRKNNVLIDEINSGFCGFNFSDTIRWKLNSKKQQLELYTNKKVFATYKVVSQTTDSHEWNNNSKEKPIQLQATILSFKLVRL